MKRLLLTFSLLISVVSNFSFAEEPEYGKHRSAYAGAAVNSSPQAIAEVHSKLLRIEIPNMDDTVPPAVSALMTTFKHQVRQIVAGVFATETQDVSAETTNDRIIASLNRGDISVVDPQNNYDYGKPTYSDIYGKISHVEVKRFDDPPNVIAVEIDYQISCGSDSTLYVFEHIGSAWIMKFALEQNDYIDVAGALGGFDYEISPADTDGNWYLLYATVNNWCSSNWQGLSYSVLRPGSDAFSPETAFHAESGIYIGLDDVVKLSAHPHDFQVSYRDNDGFDAGMSRIHVHHYRFQDGKAVRIPPFAASPQGFLDEWAQMSWPEAQKWSSNSSHMARMHRLLHAGGVPDGLGGLQLCPQETTWQLEVGIDEDHPLYAEIVERGDEYFVQRMSRDADPECPMSEDATDFEVKEPEKLP